MTNNKKFPVITLCGSTRFADEFEEAQKNLTLEGNIVLAPGVYGQSHDSDVWEIKTDEEKKELQKLFDAMHRRRIDMSDSIFVINKDGYIGESTRKEIDYAMSKGIPVRYLEDR